MDKKVFNAVREMIVNLLKISPEYPEVICKNAGITMDDLYEYIDDLALIGFKEKYNQHNHPENNSNIQEEKLIRLEQYEKILSSSSRYTKKYSGCYDMSYNTSQLEEVATKLGQLEDIYEESKNEKNN